MNTPPPLNALVTALAPSFDHLFDTSCITIQSYFDPECGSPYETFCDKCRISYRIWYNVSLRSRRYSRAQGGKLEIPPAQKLSILSSAHRAHGSAHTNVFALKNQSERELLITILAGLQCSKRCQFNNCFVFFCHGEQSNSHETFAKVYTVYIMLFPNPVGKIAITSLPSNKCWSGPACDLLNKVLPTYLPTYLRRFGNQ